jgi:signal transduction histidine kinase
VALQSAALDLDRFPAFDSAAVVCAVYAVGAFTELRTALAGLALAVVGTALHAAVFSPDALVPATLGGAALPWVAGRTVRGRRGLARELKEKAVRMVLAREQEAQAATTAERVRVARELHDAVAHNLSVIAIQAGGADGLVERDPERAAQVAALIESVGRDTLAELGRLVDATAAPQPSLELVDGLARRAREGGLPVELSVEGERPALPAGVDLAAYRIVQEALANVSKHAGTARASVVVRYLRHAVEVEVADDGRGGNGSQPQGRGGGHGLVGIRERVALYDGTVHIGRRPGGGFLVHARLPV